MGNIFAGSEIVEIGIQIEKNGRDFYATMAGQAKSIKAEEIFRFLAGEEEKHVKVFQGILGKVEKYEPEGLGADDYYAYMNALAGESVFMQKDKGKEIAGKVKSDREAIDIGIGAEKDSIVFYEAMTRIVPQYDIKIVEEVIAQEQEHLKQLLVLKTAL